MKFGSQSMVAPLRRVAVKRPEDAFARIDNEWRDLNYTRPPVVQKAAEHHRHFVDVMRQAGAEIFYLPADDRTGADSLYAHDPVLVTDRGAVIFQTGKPARRGEGPAFADAFKSWDVPILGVIDGQATAEAGDMVVDVPEQEYDSLGCNILAISPRSLVMVTGNPITRSRLEAAGCKIFEIDGSEICLPGAGGPTCLTRPVLRSQ